MSIAQVFKTSATTPGTGVVVTPAGDTTGANLLLLIACDAETSQTVVDSKLNTWTSLTRYGPGPSFARITIWYCKNPTVGALHTVTVTNSITVFFAAYSGMDTSAPFDVGNGHAQASGGITSLTTNSITPSVNGELIVAAIVKNAGAAGDATSDSFVDQASIGTTGSGGTYVIGGYWSTLIQTSAGAINPTISWATGSNESVATIASFKAAGAQNLTGDVTLSVTAGLSFANNVSVGAAFTIAETSTIAFTNNIGAASSVSLTATVAAIFDPSGSASVAFSATVTLAFSISAASGLAASFAAGPTVALAFTTNISGFSSFSLTQTPGLALANNVSVFGSISGAVTAGIAFVNAHNAAVALGLAVTPALSFLNNIAAVNPLQLPISVSVMWTPSANIPSEFTISASLGLVIVDARGADVPFQLGPDSAVGPSGIFRAAEITGRPGQLRPGASGVPGIFRPDED